MKLDNLDIKKITVHKIYGKSKTNANPYAGDCKDIVKKLGTDGMETLHKRIDSCLNHKSKFYELTLVDDGDDSVYEIHKPLWGARENKFLEVSQLLADKCAASHENANIPDGLLLVIEAKLSGFKSVILVKAEKSNAFSMSGNDLQLVKDVFLSSDKTLYKVGFFVHVDNENSNKKSYRYFVYDDAFSPAKGDLAHYFYSKFLGLSTEKNSKLLTNNLYRSLKGFVEEHIDFGDKFDVLKNIDRAFLDSTRKSINAGDFKSFFPDELAEIYQSQVEVDFPHSFIRDSSIYKNIETKRITLSPETTLLLKNAPDGIITGNTASPKDVERLKATIDSGNNRNYIYALIPSSLTVVKE